LYPQKRNREMDSFKDESKDLNSFLGATREEEIIEIVCLKKKNKIQWLYRRETIRRKNGLQADR
jgi:hypothetical protein